MRRLRRVRRCAIGCAVVLWVVIAGCSDEHAGGPQLAPREPHAGSSAAHAGKSGGGASHADAGAGGAGAPAPAGSRADGPGDPERPRDPEPGDPEPGAVVSGFEARVPQRLGTLVGPGTARPPAGLELYGTDLGLSYQHGGALHMLFGDTWPTAQHVCETSLPFNDDVLATLPARFEDKVPELSFVVDPARPARARPIELWRGETSLSLGYGQVPMTAFSDGDHAYAFFARLMPARCAAPAGEPQCEGHDGLRCSDRVGECQPAYTSVTLSCDLGSGVGCWPGQRCVAGPPACVDPSSPQYDGSMLGETAAIAQQVELAQQGEAPHQFQSQHVWATNKFATLTARTIERLGATRAESDYRPGHGQLLVWGRAGFVGEHGRQAQLFLMTHALPFAHDESGALQFAPRYFAGVDESGEPTWSDDQSRARALALDGERDGDPHEVQQFTGQMAVSWLGAPVNKWVMLYGGDITDLLLADAPATRSARAPGAIMLRFADQPWGPWSPPVPHLRPGSPERAGDLYGPGGMLHHPDCSDQSEARCVPSDPRRPQDGSVPGCPFGAQAEDPGRLYGVNIIDEYTAANDEGGLDFVWNVSLWNPYAVALMKTRVVPRPAPSAPDELADAQGLARMSDWRGMPELAPGRRYRQQSSRDRGETDTSFPLSNFGNRDFNNFLCASADAQLDANQFAPFRFDAARCEEDYVRGAVLARFTGPGRLVRTWLGAASLVLGPADDEVLRIYVDDDPVPRVEQPLAEVLDGSAGEIFAPPFGAGSALRMAWYYPLAFQHKLVVALDNLGEYDEYYYHCDVVHDDALRDAPLEHATLAAREHAFARLGSVYHPAGRVVSLGEPVRVALAAGEQYRVELAGPATIHELQLRVTEAQLPALAGVRVSVRWDHQRRDAVAELPLLELFASGRVPPTGSSHALTSYAETGERVLVLKLPMPFESWASFAFENGGTAPAAFALQLRGERALPARPFGKLHVTSSESTRGQTAEHLSVDMRGRGRFVGLCAFLEGRPDPAGGLQYDPLNLLEGDVRVLTDGELALDGTGTEEYADDVFYFSDAPHANAFAQAWSIVGDVASNVVGQANLCRWHVLGTELDFSQELQVRFELGGAANPQIVDRHHTVAYVYLEDEE